MKKIYPVFLFFFTFCVSVAQTPVIPVSTTTSYTEAFGTVLVNAYNGAGLSSFPALTGTHNSIAPDNCFVADAVVGNIDFNLGGNYDIDGLSFWNLNSSPANCVNGVAFYSSTDGVNYTPIPGGPTAFAIVNAANTEAETFNFSPVNANYIRMEVLSSHGDTFIGFSEIAFSTGNTLSTPQQEIESIGLFPNPAKTHVTVNGLKENKKYTLFNVLGTAVLKGNVSNQERIDIAALEDGIYLLKIDDAKPIRIIKN